MKRALDILRNVLGGSETGMEPTSARLNFATGDQRRPLHGPAGSSHGATADAPAPARKATARRYLVQMSRSEDAGDGVSQPSYLLPGSHASVRLANAAARREVAVMVERGVMCDFVILDQDGDPVQPNGRKIDAKADIAR